MSLALWIACSAWIALAAATAIRRGARALSQGKRAQIVLRLKSPTVYLFSGYLLVAALVTPLSAGESTSPLLWLAIVLPVGWALATLSAAGAPRGVGWSIASALLFGGAVIAAAAIALVVASPQFVPAWMR